MSLIHKSEFGREGENLAARFLEKKGYAILHRNWRSGHKELDLVARKENLLVVVEVKTRTTAAYGNPEDAVNDRKIRRIVSATHSYMKLFNIDMQVRFDIITITKETEGVRIEHIEDAFYPPIW